MVEVVADISGELCEGDEVFVDEEVGEEGELLVGEAVSVFGVAVGEVLNVCEDGAGWDLAGVLSVVR
jgi:hypothetical protein